MSATSQQPCLWKRKRCENVRMITSSVSGGNDVTGVRRRQTVTCFRRCRPVDDVVFRVALLVIFLLHPKHSVKQTSAQPVFKDFDDAHRQIFRDPNNSPGYYSTLYVDPRNSARLYVGALDFVYRLNADNISLPFQSSDNLTSTLNYTATYANSVRACQSNNNVLNTTYGCHNYVRAVFTMASTNEIYVCSTGAFNPQEYYLNSNLNVVSVERRSGSQRCPFDPAAVYAAVVVDSGNPHTPINFSSLYTGVATTASSGYVTLYRSPLYSDRFYTTPPAQTLSTVIDPTYINTFINVDAGAAFVVKVFDIGSYVYYFFREVALESTKLCSKTYFSRVARICKNDLGVDNLGLKSRFTSFFKARLVCSLSTKTDAGSVYFNQVQDVQYNASSNLFYALFTTNASPRWGSAVCKYSLSDIDYVFNAGSWVENANAAAAWVETPAVNVPSPRPGQCIGSSLTYDTNTASFILFHPLMLTLVQPVTASQPSYFSQQLSFSKLEVNVIGDYTIFYLYLPDRAEIHQISTYFDAIGNIYQSIPLSIWLPFTTSYSPPISVSTMLLSSNNQKSWLYLSTDVAVVQLSVEQCTSYSYCTHCARDPYCGWNLTSASCTPYQPGLLQAANSSDTRAVCQPNCTARYRRSNVIPGMSIFLNCSSSCEPASGDVTWRYRASRTAPAVKVDADDNYVLTQDNGLVILMVNRSKHVGVFQCYVNDNVLLTEHIITTSVCTFGDNVCEVWINEYVNYCKAFDDYNAQYKKWRCMQDYCTNTCTPNAAQCNNT